MSMTGFEKNEGYIVVGVKTYKEVGTSEKDPLPFSEVVQARSVEEAARKFYAKRFPQDFRLMAVIRDADLGDVLRIV